MSFEQIPHPVKRGKLRTRMSFSRIEESFEMPNLIEVQKNSYQNFLDYGFKEVLTDLSPITGYSDTVQIEFVDYKLDPPKYDAETCRRRDMTYAAPVKVKVRLNNSETGEIKESYVFFGDFPLMTEHGTFIVNGAERAIVSQIVRSPGAYYDMAYNEVGKRLYSGQVIPVRGAWLEFETDKNLVLDIRIDRQKKFPITIFIKALGVNSDSEIIDIFGEEERLMNTIKAASHGDTPGGVTEALIEFYKKQKPDDPFNVEAAQTLIHNIFFDPRRYDLMRVGRYKLNIKLGLFERIRNRQLANDVIDPNTGEVIATKDQILDDETALQIQNAGVYSVDIVTEDNPSLRIVGNHFVDSSKYLDFDPKEVGILENVYYPLLMNILQTAKDQGLDEEQLKELIKANVNFLVPKHILREDIFASISYFIGLPYGVGEIDDIDHLGNRRLRTVGELLQNQIRIGITKMERNTREKINTTKDVDDLKPNDVLNIKPLSSAIRDFFGSSQLSQFLDQPNPLAELTHKRRISALGPGGLNKDRASMEVRDVHYSHYGRICPIETPEGPNIGLIGSLTTYARINEYGFLEAPYRKIDKETGKITDEIIYMNAVEEDLYKIAQATEPINENGEFINDFVVVRDKEEILTVPKSQVDYMDVSSRQMVSVATSMIPFLENDDATRALMGSNMQRQAVPLLIPEAPIVGTGIEYKAAHDSGAVILSEQDGTVEYVSADEIIIKDDENKKHHYKLKKFTRGNQGTCINQHPVVSVGERIDNGQLIADGQSTECGEIGLGKNMLIGFMTWEGYNYEDAVLISERLVREDVYTSIHIEKFECAARTTKLGDEEITRDIPNVSEDSLKDLDENGIIRIGAEVRSGDILVGKVTPKGETDLAPEEKLIRAIFGEKSREVRDTSLRVPHGEGGVVVDVRIFTRANKDELQAGVEKLIRIFIAQKRKIGVGDKMAGRHGNKGVVSRVMRQEDMPYLPDGTPLDIVLNPLGVPSRMNIGQVLEVHLGMAARALGWHVATTVFDGATWQDIQSCMKKAGMREDGKTILYDGRTGEQFEKPVTVGVMYFLKLNHLVDDKMHARSVGPYAMVTQQPLGGKANFGGQRFGEMEVWALEAYGAANTLQEILTYKSDDMVGRVKTYEAIIRGQNIPNPGVPESFKVLIKELQSLSIDFKFIDNDKNIVTVAEAFADASQKPSVDLLEKPTDIVENDVNGLIGMRTHESIEDYQNSEEFNFDDELSDIEFADGIDLVGLADDLDSLDIEGGFMDASDLDINDDDSDDML